jgi:hypothetical protein
MIQTDHPPENLHQLLNIFNDRLSDTDILKSFDARFAKFPLDVCPVVYLESDLSNSERIFDINLGPISADRILDCLARLYGATEHRHAHAKFAFFSEIISMIGNNPLVDRYMISVDAKNSLQTENNSGLYIGFTHSDCQDENSLRSLNQLLQSLNPITNIENIPALTEAFAQLGRIEGVGIFDRGNKIECRFQVLLTDISAFESAVSSVMTDESYRHLADYFCDKGRFRWLLQIAASLDWKSQPYGLELVNLKSPNWPWPDLLELFEARISDLDAVRQDITKMISGEARLWPIDGGSRVFVSSMLFSSLKLVFVQNELLKMKAYFLPCHFSV